MTLSIRQALRAGLVLAVALSTTVALSLPAAARSASTAASGHSPVPRESVGMAYDAARGQVVLFGGSGGVRRYGVHDFGDTWTWDGSDWTQQHPAHSPSPRLAMGMAYDAALGEVVLFGGSDGAILGDTWTWDGTDWSKKSPAHTPSPRWGMGMAYDAARGHVVAFGGHGSADFADTWTWDGTDWTQRSPAHSPSHHRQLMGMAYDSGSGRVVLFGGAFVPHHVQLLDDTWTWDGTDWTQKSPAHSPPPRYWMGMADDTASDRVVLFGGSLGDTWTWDGTDWTQRPAGSIALNVHSGHVGRLVRVWGWGFLANERVRIVFVDSVNGKTFLGMVKADPSGAFTTDVAVPAGSTLGVQFLKAKGMTSGQTARRAFTVT